MIFRLAGPVPFGITRISVRLLYLHTLNKLNAFSGVQYCDGVRGAFIVYDPSDPLKSLYDGK